MSDDSLLIIGMRQTGQQLELVVGYKQPDGAAALPLTTIVDILGRPVEVPPPRIDGEHLIVSTLLPPPPPGADPPSYRLTVGDRSTWFAPTSPQALGTPPEQAKAPAGTAGINYLGRDYTAFTTLMRARVAEAVGDDSAWALDHPADPTTTVIEALAYTADHLSFRQDAAGTESYLSTARHRVSLARHARLRDYQVNDGCNARTVLTLFAAADGLLPQGTQVVTLQPGEPNLILDAKAPLAANTTLFETMHEQPVSTALNDLGGQMCGTSAYTLPAGTIVLTLQGQATLVPGQLIVLRQTQPPAAGTPPFGAQALRLLHVEQVKREDGKTVTNLRWHPEDALKADLTVPPAKAEGAVALYGNVVLADHGETLSAVITPATVPATGRYTPLVKSHDVVSAAPPPRIDPAFSGAITDPVAATLMVESARAALAPDPTGAAPAIRLSGLRPGMPGTTVKDDPSKDVPGVSDDWLAARDLLCAPGSQRAFAAAQDDGFYGTEQHLQLQFGDGILGARPAPGTIFTATARSGNGQSGHVGADWLVQVIGPAPLIKWITNPLPAGPSVPESAAAIRLFAATGFRVNLRGITPDDWNLLGNADPLVSEINATLTKNATPCTIGLATVKTKPDDVTFGVAEQRLLERAILGAAPIIVEAQDIAVEVALVAYCVARANVAAVRGRLQQRLGTGSLPDGSPAFFNPALWPLGRPVRLDELLAQVEGDPDVAFVVADPTVDTRIAFQALPGPDETPANLLSGQIAMATNQRVRIANDGLHPDAGSVALYVAATI